MYEIIKYQFVFTLIRNESEENYLEDGWESANFKYPMAKYQTYAAQDIERAIDLLKLDCKYFTNNDWDWESNEEGTKGSVYVGNDEDGQMLIWEVKRLGKGERV